MEPIMIPSFKGIVSCDFDGIFMILIEKKECAAEVV
jgi:hypothetical protein